MSLPNAVILLPFAALLIVAAGTAAGADRPPEPWPLERCQAIFEKTLTVALTPDLSGLTPGEKAAVEELLAAGEILQNLYEDARHPQAAAVRAWLAEAPVHEELPACQVGLYRLFQGPIATTLDNRREPFLAVAPETPGKNVYPPGITAAEVEAFLAAHPEEREAILGERTAVRRATTAALARDLAALGRHPVLDALHPGLADRLRALAAAPDPARLYAVPYAVAWADEHVALQRHLFRAADLVATDDPELARYLRNRGRDFLSNDYESGDAAWVTGRFRHLNAQIGAYETYDDALFGVKAFPSFSLLLRDPEASAGLARGMAALQEIEDALPYEPHKRVRSDIPVGAYEVIADFGQARGTNTASILPNDPLYARRYGRLILLRGNIMTDPELFAIAERRWRAAVAPPHAGELALAGGYQRTLWHEVGHYLGVDATADGRPLDQALGAWTDALEELKADLVSLFAVQRFAAAGTMSAAERRAVEADGILRTLLEHPPRRDQPYQTMMLAQMNYFLDRGLLTADADARLAIRYERYPETVAAMLGEVLALQRRGDPAAAEAFFTRWTNWDEALHERLAERLREAAGPRFRVVYYRALGEVGP
ncbi:MAG: NUDIX hydrolase [Acidobacteria bacterium]|nr:NUDIX hydrolase [Thermoanaerobaculia bacterium]NLN10410.1 NUDIX hydrolase [Acidobacteriota bacterium]MBP7813139.1 NUDIX hydrolase [Thermoanaerobaculia bacterium]MBP8845157.1 NUDIX hydrolase [Thermoanaerobaculia bacterium]HPA95764.1 NUDIX hydrolase [Thermoanaerobaculia bacterium]